MLQKIKYEDTAVFLSVIYIFLSINPLFLWNIKASIIYFLLVVSLLPIFYLLYKSNVITITRNNTVLAGLILLFIADISLPIFGHEFRWAKILLFMPLITIISYPYHLQIKIFKYFDKLIVFFSIISIIFFILFLSGMDFDTLPYYKLDGFTVPMRRGNHFYRIYGLITVPTNVIYKFQGVMFTRVCGPFQEPGHFAVILSFVILIEKILYKKIKNILIITGILTFSPVFIITLFIIELYNIFIIKKINIKIYTSILIILISGFFLIGEQNRDHIWYLTIGRNFEKKHVSPKSNNSLLNQRLLESTIIEYDKFISSSEIITGKGARYLKNIGVMSDFRGLIFKFGLIGLFLVLSIFSSLFLISNKQVFFLLAPLILLIFIHRVWMFESPYIYVFILLGIAASKNKTNSPIIN